MGLILLIIILILLFGGGGGYYGYRTYGGPGRDPSVVLVHGAYADGSSWSAVIRGLQARGFSVRAVQNPLTSLADDVASTRRALGLHSKDSAQRFRRWLVKAVEGMGGRNSE